MTTVLLKYLYKNKNNKNQTGIFSTLFIVRCLFGKLNYKNKCIEVMTMCSEMLTNFVIFRVHSGIQCCFR